MAWTKAKTAIAIGIGVLFVVGTTTVTVKELHRNYSWQIANGNSDEGLKALNTAPPQVTIVRSKFTTDKGHGSLMDDILPKDQWRYIGIHSTPSEIIERAYWNGNFLLPSQIILSPDMPSGFYDYIANLPVGSQQTLQALLKTKFGLVGKYEMRNMDVLLLKVKNRDALNLKPGTSSPKQLNLTSNGIIHFKNLPISKLCIRIEQNVQVPVIDQTGLTGTYDIDIPEKFDVNAIQEFLGQAGFELMSTNLPVERLVVEKAQ